MTVLVIVLKGATSKQKRYMKSYTSYYFFRQLHEYKKSKIEPAINMFEGYISATKEAFKIYGHA